MRGSATPLPPAAGRISPQAGVAAEATDQRDVQRGKRSQHGGVVVGAVSDEADRQGCPGFHGLQRFRDDLEAGAELSWSAVILRAVEGDPEREGHVHSEEFDEHAEHDPVVPPDVSGARPSDVVEERPRTEDLVAPLRAERLAHGQEDRLRLEGRDDEVEEQAPHDVNADLEVREEAVEARLMPVERSPAADRPDRALPLMHEPGQRDREEVGPAALGEGRSESHCNIQEARCKLKGHHGLTSASDNRLYQKIGCQTSFL